MSYIKESTDKDAVFLFLENDRPLSFHRIAERENFVVWKFTPTTSEAIYEWHERKKWLTAVSADISKLDSLINKYRIHYVIGSNNLNNKLLYPVFSEGDLSLYKIMR